MSTRFSPLTGGPANGSVTTRSLWPYKGHLRTYDLVVPNVTQDNGVEVRAQPSVTERFPQNPGCGCLRLPDSALVSGTQHQTQKESPISCCVPARPSKSAPCQDMFCALGASFSYAPQLRRLGPHPPLTAQGQSTPGPAWGRPALT